MEKEQSTTQAQPSRSTQPTLTPVNSIWNSEFFKPSFGIAEQFKKEMDQNFNDFKREMDQKLSALREAIGVPPNLNDILNQPSSSPTPDQEVWNVESLQRPPFRLSHADLMRQLGASSIPPTSGSNVLNLNPSSSAATPSASSGGGAFMFQLPNPLTAEVGGAQLELLPGAEIIGINSKFPWGQLKFETDVKNGTFNKVTGSATVKF